VERRLAAVLIADVVGYVRLSQVDEEGTRAGFQADLREVFEPNIAAHHGRLVKTMGDALLVEFQSIVDALRCAVNVQRFKIERNAGLPKAKCLVYRIGINLGDVIVEGDDIHGDGVSIADRLQALADPGGIAISGTAYDHVKSKAEIGFAYLGEQPVKHVTEPVRVYRVLMEPTAAGKTIGSPSRQWRSWRRLAVPAAIVALIGMGVAWWATSRTTADVLVAGPSIVVLPFDNLNDDKEQGYLADGMTEDLTTELARVPGLFVISRNAAFGFRGRNLRPAQIAQELGVRYILEGSLRRAGEDIRINAQLIDATTGGHLWAEHFDGAWAQVFDLQDKIVGEIATALKLRLVVGQRASQTAGGTSNPVAYEAYLRGLEFEHRASPEDFVQAV
jgi:adenylate cyclase